jgi:very-short-patch-repair endonuclease
MEVGSGYRNKDPSRLLKLVEGQHGVVAMWQLEECGYSRWMVNRRVKAAELHPIHRGVFAVGHRRLSYRGQWMAAVLACGPDAVLSHHAAAALWDLRPIPQGQTDVTAPVKRTHEGVRCHVSSVPAQDRTTIDGIPATGLVRTYLDYAERATPRQLTEALEAGQRRNIFDFRELQSLIDRSPGRKGLKRLTTALGQLTDDPEWTQSKLERDFRHLIRTAPVPKPSMNVVVEGEPVDCAWIDQKLILELDGYGYHHTKRRFEDDRRRDMKLQLRGWRVIRVTYERLQTDGPQVVADVRRMLGV